MCRNSIWVKLSLPIKKTTMSPGHSIIKSCFYSWCFRPDCFITTDYCFIARLFGRWLFTYKSWELPADVEKQSGLWDSVVLFIWKRLSLVVSLPVLISFTCLLSFTNESCNFCWPLSSLQLLARTGKESALVDGGLEVFYSEVGGGRFAHFFHIVRKLR